MTEPDQSPSLWDWHANLLRIERKRWVLFTNDQTLYSFFVRFGKRPLFPDFVELFRLGLFKNLMGEGLTEPLIDCALKDYRNVTIAKTNSRSVLGSMNDLAFQLKCSIETMGGLDRADLSEVGRRLNRIPMSAIKYHCSIDELKRRLADAHK
ncbi:hypothetical protein [Dehalogenimonas sp. 4OHTPN]|uniref:DUF6933 domain-containing protein n=1 Tax=Dehalogenimonas sp. 4OHTPN TaxID=3166643 RepID=A0AAU8GAT0_9CHLR